ncbi:MAG: 3-isopropylmalate dehydratase large subunit [Gammaproteobacteria bacterium]|nr:3-isopropylmalate dehydratase large subunit [Gammaproteobacteria bacterium]
MASIRGREEQQIVSQPKTLFDKIWERVEIHKRDDGQSLLYVDRHLCHEGGARGFSALSEEGKTVRRPDLTFATADHFISTQGPTLDDIEDPSMRARVVELEAGAKAHGVKSFTLGDPNRGIVHVVGPEQGLTQPGLLLVCGDSHTSTHGALGAFAFGIGSTEVSHVLATQCLWQSRPKTMRIRVDGVRRPGVTAKDVVLAIIAQIGARGATGYVIEYAGQAIEQMSIEERMTVCNMSIEAGGRAGMIAPDEKTYAYLKGRPYAPSGDDWDAALAMWKTLPSDPGATFDREESLDASEIAPMITWGTSPEQASPITANVPKPIEAPEDARKLELAQTLMYMGLRPGMALTDVEVDGVFIGSCTNGRLPDLRAAAEVARGRQAKVKAIVVPGSGLVKAAAEAEGLDKIFVDAGFEWRESGCSMCCSFNGDSGTPESRWVSTSNRNFRGRQGPGVRTHLASPAMAAAAAVTGRLTDVRELLEE